MFSEVADRPFSEISHLASLPARPLGYFPTRMIVAPFGEFALAIGHALEWCRGLGIERQRHIPASLRGRQQTDGGGYLEHG
jgi:hypothetical protein